MWHHGFDGLTPGPAAETIRATVSSGICARISQLSLTVLPVLKPPDSVKPLRTRDWTFIRNPLKCWYWFPKFAASVLKLFGASTAAACVSLNNPVGVAPLAAPRRESVGALTPNGR